MSSPGAGSGPLCSFRCGKEEKYESQPEESESLTWGRAEWSVCYVNNTRTLFFLLMEVPVHGHRSKGHRLMTHHHFVDFETKILDTTQKKFGNDSTTVCDRDSGR